MDACTLVLHHDQKFDLVDEADLDGRESLGEYRVLTPKGEETRQKVLVDDPDPESVTTMAIPDGYDDSPTALTHLAQALLDRHAPGEAITGVSSPDNHRFARRLAALMGVDYLQEAKA